MKTCNKCNTEKPVAEFSLRGGKPRATCRVCENEARRARRIRQEDEFEKRAAAAGIYDEDILTEDFKRRQKVNAASRRYRAKLKANPKPKTAQDIADLAAEVRAKINKWARRYVATAARIELCDDILNGKRPNVGLSVGDLFWFKENQITQHRLCPSYMKRYLPDNTVDALLRDAMLRTAVAKNARENQLAKWAAERAALCEKIRQSCAEDKARYDATPSDRLPAERELRARLGDEVSMPLRGAIAVPVPKDAWSEDHEGWQAVEEWLKAHGQLEGHIFECFDRLRNPERYRNFNEAEHLESHRVRRAERDARHEAYRRFCSEQS